MFNNLIESSSHASEFKRRGSFVLFTSATYVLLFIIAGVASIYAYDARLDDQNTEIVTMLSPVELPSAPVAVNHSPQPTGHHGTPGDVIRVNPMSSVNHPENPPDHVSATPNLSQPVPETGRWRLGDHDSGPIEPGGNDRPRGSDGPVTGADGPRNIDVGTPPPPQPVPSPRRVITSPHVLNGSAIALPKPIYPLIAKQARIQGSVNVQVLVDEMGRVVSAKAISGSPMLMHAAQQAALEARFSPTKLGEQAVKVSGVIVYNFILQ
jgi:protein TonB